MAYAVSLPGGMQDFEYSAYIRQLVRDGVDITRAPRVKDPSGAKRWLFAWKKKEEAKAFAEKLRLELERSKWRVCSVPGPHADLGRWGRIGLALRAYLRLEWNLFSTGISWTEAKAAIIRDAVRVYLAYPTITLPTA